MTILQEHTKKGSIRTTFILLFILVSSIPILILGSISLASINATQKETISELEQQTLLTTSSSIELFFTTIIDTLSTNFDTLDQTTLEQATTSWQEVYAKKFTEDNNAILEVSFVNLQGKEVAKYSRINSSPTLLYLSELPLFKKAQQGNIAISDVHQTLHGESVTIAVPSRVNGQVFNVVVAEISLTPLVKLLDNTRIYTTGYVSLFDNKSTRVGSKNGSQRNFSEWSRVSDILNGHIFDGLSSVDRYISPLTSVPVVSSGRILPITHWALIVEWPISEANSLIERFRNTVLITIIISILIVILVAILLSNHLVMPIRLLQEATTAIEKGNFDKQVSITTDNELEELGDSFNTMAIGLKRLEELKNEFVYVAAHELRAPVTAIKGYLELIFDGSGGNLSPEMEHLLSPIRKSNDRLVNLVNDLLKVARSEAGKLEIAITPEDIRNEIEAIIEEAQPLAHSKNITLTYHKPETLPLVTINTGSIKEVIMNFVSNAIKYGNDNGTVTITHEVHDGLVATSIADNVRGISDEDQKYLFEKFFRAPDVKNTSIEGTGLGLFITKELVEKMGGTLTVVSTIGVGTTFTITFKESH